MDWVQREADAARLRLGVEGFPTEADLLRLTEAIGVRLRHADVTCPYCFLTDRGATITLPLSWRGEENDELLCHELAHAIFPQGSGKLLRFLYPGNPRMERLARIHDAKDEAVAEAFVRAWFRR